MLLSLYLLVCRSVTSIRMPGDTPIHPDNIGGWVVYLWVVYLDRLLMVVGLSTYLGKGPLL